VNSILYDMGIVGGFALFAVLVVRLLWRPSYRKSGRLSGEQDPVFPAPVGRRRVG